MFSSVHYFENPWPQAKFRTHIKYVKLHFSDFELFRGGRRCYGIWNMNREF
jgi:hypothetical protein